MNPLSLLRYIPEALGLIKDLSALHSGDRAAVRKDIRDRRAEIAKNRAETDRQLAEKRE